MRDRRRWYRPGPCQWLSPPQAVGPACRRRSRLSVERGQIRCVGTVRRAAGYLSPLVDQRTGGLVDLEVGGAVEAYADLGPAHPLRAHRDHSPAATCRTGDQADDTSPAVSVSSGAVCRAW